MATWHEGFVAANSLQFHYIRTGHGEQPPLLLLHGLTDAGRYWSRTAAALEDRFDVVMLDQRGHGQSSRSADGYSAEEMAADAAGVIQALGIAPVAVLGHSMGGSVAIALAATYPDLVTRVLLLYPALVLGPVDAALGEPRRQHMEGWRREILADQQLSLASIEDRCVEQHPAWAREDCHYLAEAHLQVDADVIPRFHALGRWQDQIPRIGCPILLIHGDKALGSIVDDALAAEIAALAPNVQPAHIAAAGHSAQRDQFDAYIAAVSAFLQ